MSTDTLIIVTAIALWFAHGWYLNERLKIVHQKMDRMLEQFDGLRRYLYEIDPQFNDERGALEEFDTARSDFAAGFAAMDHIEIRKRKESEGRRTLNTPFA